jgi:hypothetical protein
MGISHYETQMHRSVLPLAAAFVLSSVTLGAQAKPAARPDSLTLARQFTAWFYAGEIDSLMAHHPAEDRSDSTVREGLQRNLDMLSVRAGTETAVLEEKFVMRNRRPQYWRTAKFTNMSESVLLRWVINPQGEIIGMGLGPLSQAPPIDPKQ